MRVEPESVLNKLKLAGWQSWSKIERNSVEHYLKSAFLEIVKTGDGYDIDSWLCGVARCSEDIEEFLHVLKCYPKGLADFYEAKSSELMKNNLGGFWNDTPQNRDRVLEWIQSNEVRTIINEEFARRYT